MSAYRDLDAHGDPVYMSDLLRKGFGLPARSVAEESTKLRPSRSPSDAHGPHGPGAAVAPLAVAGAGARGAGSRGAAPFDGADSLESVGVPVGSRTSRVPSAGSRFGRSRGPSAIRSPARPGIALHERDAANSFDTANSFVSDRI